MSVRTGLEVLLSDHLDSLKGARVGFCCNQTAIAPDLEHAVDKLTAAGVNLVRLFAPEHGVRATVQDMVGLDEATDPITGLPVVSLYKDSAASLHPPAEALADLDVCLFDIQDIGARYYTYQATLGFIMAVAGTTNTKVVVLDRPNPINGVDVEGNCVNPGFESFVGAYPIAVRHGMTVGELAGYFQQHCGVTCETEVIRCQGWDRRHWFDQTGLPWVYPSPNMPTLETAAIYPGMCLIEGTDWSEGRGTTRPFFLVGAPGVDPQALTIACREGAARAGLEGVGFRPAAFLPGYQKCANTDCTGVEVHLLDRDKMHALLLGMVVTEACYRVGGADFAWRTKTYEFVDDPVAIDLLTGSTEFRECVESGGSLRDVLAAWEPQRQGFLARREGCLLY